MNRTAPLLILCAALAIGVGSYVLQRSGSDEKPIAAPSEKAPEREVLERAELSLEESGSQESLSSAAEREKVPTAAEDRLEGRIQLAAGLAIPFRLVDDLGQPIAKAAFTLAPAGGEDFEVELTTKDGDLALSMPTAGLWSVAVSVRDHRPVVARNYEVPHEGPPVVLKFLRNGNVRGRVVDDLGLPVPSIEVRVSPIGIPGSTSLADKTTTDENGVFLVESMVPGPLEARVSTEFTDKRVGFDLQAGGEIEIEIRMPAGGYIQGHVYDAENRPTADAAVLLAADVNLVGEGTDDEGYFFMGPIPPGEYQLLSVLEGEDDQPIFLPALTVVVENGATLDVELRPARETHALRGRVFVGESALPECEIMVFREDRGLMEGIRATRTDESGNYSLNLIGPGAHLFYFEPHDDPRGDPAAPQRVLLADGQHELDFHLPLGEISGRLVTGEGEGVGSVHVVALREDGYLDQLLPFDDGAVKTGSDGRFRITLLSDGTYTLMAYGRRAWKSRSGIRIAGDTVTGIELTLLPSGSVQGHVYDAEHRPVDDAVVFARDAGGKLLWGHKDDTNSKGEFRFAVPAGTVTLFARMWGAAAPDTAPLTVRAGERTVGIEIFIAPAARLWVTTLVDDVPTPATVRVYNEEGREVSRAQVDLEGMAGALRDPLSATSRAVGPLPAGRYQVVATSLAGRATQEYVNLGSEDVEVALRLK